MLARAEGRAILRFLRKVRRDSALMHTSCGCPFVTIRVPRQAQEKENQVDARQSISWYSRAKSLDRYFPRVYAHARGRSDRSPATQQRRKSAVKPRVREAEVIELSDSDEPAPPQPASTQGSCPGACQGLSDMRPRVAKRPRASAPAAPEDIINITDSDEDQVRPSLQSTQSAPSILLKYDADGFILIDDDEDEPVEKPVSALPGSAPVDLVSD